MVIEKIKAGVSEKLREMERDCEILQERTKQALADIEKVETMDDLIVFEDTHPLEQGLSHIELF